MPAPLVTVITPTLNADKYFEETLVSLRQQTLAADRVEHLVIDAGSTDRTLEILRDCSPASRVVSYPGSIYAAMNHGIALANSPVVAWLNADDLFLPTALEAALRALDARPSAGVAVSHYQLFGDGWETLYRTRIDAFSLIRSGRAWRWFDIWAMPLGVFFRTSLLRALGGYSLKYPIVGDLDLWYRAASLEPAVDVVHTGAVAGRFRVHGGSLSTGDRMDRMFVEKLAFLQSLIDGPDTPAGVRISARRMFRHDVLALAFWNAKNRSVSQLPAEMAARFQQFRAAGPGALLDFVSALPIGVHDALVDVARVGPLVNSLWALTGGPEHRRDDWVSRAERPAKNRSRTAVR